MKKIINPWKGLEGYNCFGCAPNNEAGIKMEFYEDGDEVVSIWKPRPEYQGWINTLHGGIQAVLMDEICAWVILRKLQTTGVTSKMETKLYNKDGEVCTEAVCTYFTFSHEKSKDEMHFDKCDVEPEEILPLI